MATETAARTQTDQPRWRQLFGSQEVTLLAVILVLAVILTILNPVFASAGNITELFRSTVVYFIMACGSAMIIVAGGFDFSVGSVFTLGSVSTAALMVGGLPWPLAVLAGLAIGALAGLINAVIIERLGVPPIITTLGTYYFIFGVVVIFSGGRSIVGLPAEFTAMVQNNLLGIPLLIVYGAVTGVVAWFVLERTPYGTDLRAIGGNRNAAIASGIAVKRIDRWVYAIGGLMAAFAGILYTGRTGIGDVNAGGATITLAVVSAVLIGGVSLFGGTGSIIGVALGAVLLSVIQNGLAVAGIPALYESMIIGVILILAVAADYFRRKRAVRPAA